MKASAKRRRSRAQIEEEKQQAAQQKAEIDQKLARINLMQQEMEHMRSQIALAEEMRS